MAEITLKELKDILDDDELDLSARGLAVVPKAMYQLPKARNIDLSGNKLTVFPKELCSMTRLVRLDLASNKLVVLPDCIGNLVNLEHLNLFNNRIEDLPLSFADLRSLKWLDLKRNPLLPDLQSAVGNCGTDKECRAASSSVMKYIQNVKNSVHDQVKKQEKVIQKVQSVKAEQKNIKKKDLKNKSEGVSHVGPVSDPVSRMAKGNKSKNHSQPQVSKNQNGKKGSFFGNLFGFLFRVAIYVGIALIVSSTIKIGAGCYGFSSEVQGSKALCKDIKSIAHFTKPSAQFANNVKGTYATVFSEYHRAAQYHWTTVSTKGNQYWKQFTKSSAGKSIETGFYKVHAFVVEKTLHLQKFVLQQWSALCNWYAKDGQVFVGEMVANVKVAAGVVFEMIKDVAAFASGVASVAYHRLEQFILVWQEKGFAKAVEDVSSA